MGKYSNKKKYFVYNDETLYYIIKDIEPTEHNGEEWARAFMLIFDENDNNKDSFIVTDERIKVLYAMPNDAKLWYEKYKNLKG